VQVQDEEQDKEEEEDKEFFFDGRSCLTKRSPNPFPPPFPSPAPAPTPKPNPSAVVTGVLPLLVSSNVVLQRPTGTMKVLIPVALIDPSHRRPELSLLYPL